MLAQPELRTPLAGHTPDGGCNSRRRLPEPDGRSHSGWRAAAAAAVARAILEQQRHRERQRVSITTAAGSVHREQRERRRASYLAAGSARHAGEDKRSENAGERVLQRELAVLYL